MSDAPGPTAPTPPEGRPAASPLLAAAGTWMLVALASLLFLLRASGPSNLTDNDQERPASYMLDAAVNGHWIVQRDWTGDITSKPPLYTWLAAAAGRAFGITLTSLYLPCGLALVGAALVVHRVTLGAAGPRVALLAGFFFLANPLSAKLAALARTDPVFTFTVAWTSARVFQAWQRGRGWSLAGLAAALATLTKGPLGAVLGLAGLAAAACERTGIRPPLRPGRLAAGLLWIPLLAGGWFLLAWAESGSALIDKMLKAELVNHAMGERGAIPGQGFALAPAYFLGRFAPWSLLALAGLWDAWKRPEPDPAARRWQRFAAAGLVLGLVPFALASHQRGDLIAPLMPAGAVLAAFPAARWTARWSDRRLVLTLGLAGVVAAFAFQAQHTRRALPTFRETAALRDLASAFVRNGGHPGQLGHLEVPYALQFFLGTMHQAHTPESAAAALRQGRLRYVATRDPSALERELGPAGPRLRVFAEVPETEGGASPRIRIVELEAAGAGTP